MQRRTPLVLLALALLAAFANATPVQARSVPPLTDAELNAYWTPFQATFRSIEEVRPLAELAAKLNVRVWFFGGTATSIAVEGEKNQVIKNEAVRSSRIHRDHGYRTLSQIKPKSIAALLRPSQDIDVVVDGPVEAIAALETEIKQRYPFIKEYKSAWDFRSLRDSYNGKPSVASMLMGDIQNTDSLSTTFIEITQAPGMGGYPSVIDFKNQLLRKDLYWSPGNSYQDGAHNAPALIHSVIKGMAEFIPSAGHTESEAFKRHDNPEIISVLRILNKAFAHNLVFDETSQAKIESLIEAFAPKLEVLSDYARARIESEAVKILFNAHNLNEAWDYLEKTGLRKKLLDLPSRLPPGTSSAKESLLSYWMSREPVPSFPAGDGEGDKAIRLGIRHIFVETGDFRSDRAIRGSPYQTPNLCKSDYSNGVRFYIDSSPDASATRSALRINMVLDEIAREGTDFERGKDANGAPYILVKNRQAVSLVAEKPLPPGERHPKPFVEEILGNQRYEFRDRGFLQQMKAEATVAWKELGLGNQGTYLRGFLSKRPHDFALQAPKWTYLPDEIAGALITDAHRRAARSELRGYLGAADDDTPDPSALCGNAFLVAEFLLKSATRAEEFLDLIRLPEGHPCHDYFENLWLENLHAFVQTLPTAKQLGEARRASGFKGSTQLLTLTLGSRNWDASEFFQLIDPLWETPTHHSYTQEMVAIWGKNLHRYFGGMSYPYDPKKVVEKFRQTPKVPLGELLRLYIGFGNPTTEEPFRRAFDLAPLVVETLKKNPAELVAALDGIFRALEGLHPRGWDTNHLMIIRNSFSGSRLASTYFINRFVNQVDLTRPQILALFFSPSPQPKDAPEWSREIALLKKKALTQLKLQTEDCNAALQ